MTTAGAIGGTPTLPIPPIGAFAVSGILTVLRDDATHSRRSSGGGAIHARQSRAGKRADQAPFFGGLQYWISRRSALCRLVRKFSEREAALRISMYHSPVRGETFLRRHLSSVRCRLDQHDASGGGMPGICANSLCAEPLPPVWTPMGSLKEPGRRHPDVDANAV